MFHKFIRPLCFISNVSHMHLTCNTYHLVRFKLSLWVSNSNYYPSKPFRVILCMFSKFIRPLCYISHLSRNICYISHLSHFYLAHISNFQSKFLHQIATPSKSFRVILCMFSKFIRLSCYISHLSRNISHLSCTHFKPSQ